MKANLLRGLVAGLLLVSVSNVGPMVETLLRYPEFRIDPSMTCVLAGGYELCKFYDPNTRSLCYIIGIGATSTSSAGVSCREYP